MRKGQLEVIIVFIITVLFLVGCQQNASTNPTAVVTVSAEPESSPTATPKPEPQITSIQATMNSVFSMYDNGNNDVFGLSAGISQAQNIQKTDSYYGKDDMLAQVILYDTDVDEGLVYIALNDNVLNTNAFEGAKIIDIAAGGNFAAGLSDDGKVLVFPYNDEEIPELDVTGWTNIIQIEAGTQHIVGLKSDGSVVATGDNTHGQCNVSDWTDVISVSTGYIASTGMNYTVGLEDDGTLIITCESESTSEKLFRDAVSEFSDIVSFDASNTTIAGMNSNGELIVFICDARLFLGKVTIKDILDYDVLGNSVIVMKTSGELESISGWNAFLYDSRWQSGLKDVVSDEFYIYALNAEQILSSDMQIFDTSLVPNQESANGSEEVSPASTEKIDPDKLEKDWQKLFNGVEKERKDYYSKYEKKYLKQNYADESFKKMLFSGDKSTGWDRDCLMILDSAGVLWQDISISTDDGEVWQGGMPEPWIYSCPIAIADFCVLPDGRIIAITERGDVLIGTGNRNQLYVLSQIAVEMNDNIRLVSGYKFAAIYDGDGVVMPKELSLLLNPYFCDSNADFSTIFDLKDINSLQQETSTETQESSNDALSSAEIESRNKEAWETFILNFDGDMPDYTDELRDSTYVFRRFKSNSSIEKSLVISDLTKEKYEKLCTITLNAGYKLKSEYIGDDGTISRRYFDKKNGVELRLTFCYDNAENDYQTQVSISYLSD